MLSFIGIMTVVLFKSLYHLEIHIKILMLEIIQCLGFPSKHPEGKQENADTD